MLRTLMLAFLLLPCSAFARDWQVDAAKSSLSFRGTYQGQAFEGRFTRFQAAIRYDPNALAASKFDVTVALASADTASSERDDALQGSDFFDSAKFPQAHFVTTGFVEADGGVEANGTLTIRDRTRPVTLKVRFVENGDGATLDVATTLKRTDFGLGASSDWDDIGVDVPVQAHLVLSGK